MERLQQVRQLLKQDDVVYVVTAYSLTEPHEPILLVLAVNLPVKDAKTGIPKIHRVKGRGDLLPLNYKSVSQLELVECGAEASLSMTYAKKRYDWVIKEGSAVRNTFVWWVLQTCRVYNDDKVPACSLDPIIIHQLTALWISAHHPALDQPNRVQLHILEQVRSKVQAENTQGFEVPPMKEQEAADIEYFLKANELGVANIDELEELLHGKLRDLEDQNIRDLFLPEYLNSAQGISTKLDGVVGEISTLQQWMATSDDELAGMRAGLEKMTVQLEVQENNLERLVQVLEPLLRSLTLKEEDIRTLEDPKFSHLEHALAAAKELDNALRQPLEGSLQHMEGVVTQRKRLKAVRTRFCASATSYLCSQFEQTKAQGDITNLAHHEKLLRYKELVRYIERLEPEKFVELQQNYVAQYQKVYEVNITNYLNASRGGVTHEQKHTKFSALEEHSQLRKGPPPPPPVRQGGTKAMTEVFPTTLHTLLAAVNSEQRFLDDFFGMQSDANNDDDDDDDRVASPSHASSGVSVASGDHNSTRDDEYDLLVRPTKAKNMLQSLFKSLESELKALMEWADKLDHFYSLDMLVVIERESEGKINDFSLHLISHLRNHLNNLFRLFVDGEIHWIASQKVPAKRCGVLAPFVKFPQFVERMESTSQRGRSQAVDATYQKIVGALFAHLDSVASSDEKYTDVVQLENHYYFWRIFSTRPDPVPALEPFVTASRAKFQVALKKYVAWNVEYELDTIAKFWTKLEAALKSVSKLTEIPIMADLSKPELHKLITEHMTNHKITKRIRLMLERIQKHLTVTDLPLEVWNELKTYFISRYKWFEDMVSQCYTKETLIVPSKDLAGIFDLVWAQNETDKKKPKHKRSVSVSVNSRVSRSSTAK